MKIIKFKRNCNYKGKTYNVGDELKNITKNDISDIRKLNEKGFIEPLTQEELNQIADGSFFNKKKSKEE